MSKVKIRLDDPETRAIWETAQKAKAEVEAWPAWKRGDVTGRQAMSEERDFWKSVEAISDQQRQLPRELRRMAGVPKQTFRLDRLHGASTQPKSKPLWTIPAAGWTCPKCQRIWGPQVEECKACNEWEEDDDPPYVPRKRNILPEDNQ